MDDRLDCLPEASSVRLARQFVVEKLTLWRCDDFVDAAALATSELATNAVVHTGLPYSVHVERCDGGVRVEVADAGGELPPRPEAARPTSAVPIDANRLFSGLRMVDAVASRWGSEHLPEGGKVVWFELTGAPLGRHA